MATIRVSFAELRTTGHYSNMRAEASIEMESQDPEKDFPTLWERVRNEVRGQLDAEERHRREDFEKAVREFFEQGDEGPGSDGDSIDEDEEDYHEYDEGRPQEYKEPDPFADDGDEEVPF